jgi:hypothetical protein
MAKHTPTARLRKTFHYPSDDDDSTPSTPEVLDEQGAFPPQPYHLYNTNPPTQNKP